MRKRIACCGIAIALFLVLVASTPALSGSRSAARERSEAAELRTAPSRGTITVHRLLRIRAEWTMRLSRLLEALDEPTYGTRTIIDEPDPVGMSGDSEEPPDASGPPAPTPPSDPSGAPDESVGGPHQPSAR